MDRRTRKQRARTEDLLQPAEGAMTEANARVPSQTSAELMRAFSAIANTITATAMNAEAGLYWLSTQPSDLEEVRRSLNSIANDGKRASEVVVRLRALIRKVRIADLAPAEVPGDLNRK